MTFIGHWPVESLRLPGTEVWRAVPFAGTHEHPNSKPAEAGDDHAQHCHVDVASCTDIPLTSVSAFALLNESVAYAGAGALLIAMCLALWQPKRPNYVRPELQPPRAPLPSV